MIALVLVLATPPAPASAFSYRYYSVGFEYAPAYQLTGILTVHADAPISVSPGEACQSMYDNRANPVFLTQWVAIAPNTAQDQIEIGTGHQCNGFVYQFWGYRINGYWEPLNSEIISPTYNGRYFDVHRLSQNGHAYWYYYIQGVQKAPILAWDVAGYFIDAGLETSDVSAVVANHWFTELQKTVAEGPWQPWGADLRSLVDHATLCGFFRSSTQWSAGQNSGCS